MRQKILIGVLVISAIIIGSMSVFWLQSSRTSQLTKQTPPPTSETTAGAERIESMYIGYKNVVTMSLAEREAYLKPFTTDEFQEKFAAYATKDFDGILCAYSPGKPQNISYGTPFISQESDGDYLVSNVTIKFNSSSPSVSAVAFVNTSNNQIHVTCNIHP